MSHDDKDIEVIVAVLLAAVRELQGAGEVFDDVFAHGRFPGDARIFRFSLRKARPEGDLVYGIDVQYAELVELTSVADFNQILKVAFVEGIKDFAAFQARVEPAP